MILEEFRRKKVSGGEAVLFSHVRHVAFFYLSLLFMALMLMGRAFCIMLIHGDL